VLTLRDFGLTMGERCRLSQVNLDLGARDCISWSVLMAPSADSCMDS
jgi:hypothetical protein